MTALIAMAVGVAAIILTRGGEAADDLERTSLTRRPSEFTTQVLCEAYEFTWTFPERAVRCVLTRAAGLSGPADH